MPGCGRSVPAAVLLARRSLMGPLKLSGSTTCPFWVIWITPCCASCLAACLVGSMRLRQSPLGRNWRGTSLGQQVAPGLRLRSRSARMVLDNSCWSGVSSFCFFELSPAWAAAVDLCLLDMLPPAAAGAVCVFPSVERE